ncbi:MAG: hypothetical protein KAJ19_28170, partial [Gammaproteobacteria bacterium]|nr:hypothetical protein [Gammaproteobacteria bacterium]
VLNKPIFNSTIEKLENLIETSKEEISQNREAFTRKLKVTKQEAFEKAISNPANYHAGKPEEGVAHIFYPDTLKRDPNYRTNQRLESHGLALKAFVDNIVDGVVEDKKWGYKTEKEVEKPTIKAISSLAGFFKAIDYPTAPSVGNWEEFPFPGGLTSDTEMIRSSFESLHDLMYNPSYDKNPIIASVRERLVKTEYGSFLSDEKELKRLVKIGKERVQKTYLEESPNIRPHDSSLAFVTSSTIKLDNDPLRDIEKHMEILDSLEKHLVKDNGMVRFTSYDFLLKDGKIHSSDSSLGKEGKADIEHVYSSDSYISLNYNVALDREGKINLKWKDLRDEFGSCDARDPAAFGVRPHFSNPNSDAQWFMVGDMASGYGKQLEKLLKITDGRTATKEEQKLIDKTLSKSTEYLNRSLARVTENNPTEKSQITANGVKCQSFCVPEAYQHVSSLKKDENGNSKEVLIPGINTPLAWATASLFKAMNQCRGNIKELEKRKQHDNNVVTSEKMRSKLSR